MATTIVFTALLVHAAVCLLFLLLIKTDRLKISAQLWPLAVFLPFFGYGMLLTAEVLTRRQKNGTKQLQVDDLKLDEHDFRGLNLLQDDKPSIVPLEEAMYVNDPQTRRNFLIDIIGEGAGQYTDLLKKAKYNDDSEVTHYASAAIMEVQRNYELTLQSKQAAVKQDPQDVQALESYIRTVKNYIGSGLVEENFLTIQRRRYHRALERRIAMPGPDRDFYFDAADNLIELGETDAAEEILSRAKKKWPGDERVWLLRLKICHLSKNPKKRNELVAALSRSRVFLSTEAREAIRFWSR